MNRRKFLKSLGIGAGSAAAAIPLAFANKLNKAYKEANPGAELETDKGFGPEGYLIIREEVVVGGRVESTETVHDYSKLRNLSYEELVQYFKENP